MSAGPAPGRLTVTPVRAPGGRGLRGRLRVPGDKSISHRALLFAALAEGRSTLRGLSGGEDVQHTVTAMQAFGAVLAAEAGRVVVDGGPSRLHEPAHVIDVGNSGTGIRLLAGWSAGRPGLTVLEGDQSIAGRPMARVVEPLRAMGASVDGRHDGQYPPLVVRGGGLHGIDYRPAVASAQVKAALLLAGLAAEGETTIREAVATRAHTEEMLARAGADFTIRQEAADYSVTVRPSALSPFTLDVPSDPSQAAFWVVAGCVVPGSDLVVEHVYVGPGRAGFLDVLARMGADISVEEHDDEARTADIRARYSPLRATDVGGVEVPGLIDEIPVLAVAAAYAEGVTTFSDAAELRVKESNRVTTTTAGLRALGAQADERADGLVVAGSGGRPLAGGTARSEGDHRIAMAMAVAALAAEGPVTIEGWASVATSYPSFEEDLRQCVIAIDGPAGSGKSTVARAVAERLGLDYLDTGAMYRAVAFAAIRRNIDPADADPVSRLARDLELEVADVVTVDGVDATIEIRSPEVTRAVSAVAANPEVRRELVRRQREWAAAHGGGVVEGRDIGTVVFPDASLKVYLTAADSERATRRSKEMLALRYDQVAADIARRDHADSTRHASPLVVADDAVRLDTTGMEVSRVVDAVLELVDQLGPARP